MKSKIPLFLLIIVLVLTGCSVYVQPTPQPVPPGPAPSQYYEPSSPPPPQEDISFFYDQLSPYGEWFQIEAYGWVWTPHNVPYGWRPYTDGRWAYTDYGWTWISDLEWGWAPFHYGRWFFDPSYGWVWIPGREWAPAWVAWHYGNGWVGWAPLPPGVDWRTGVNIDVNIRPNSWCFVEERSFVDPNLRTSIVLPARNVTLINITQHVTNYTIVNNQIFNRSLDVDSFEKNIHHPIPRYRIVDHDTVPSTHERMKGNDIYMFRHRIAETTPKHTPPRAEPYPRREMPGQKPDMNIPQEQPSSQKEPLQHKPPKTESYPRREMPEQKPDMNLPQEQPSSQKEPLQRRETDMRQLDTRHKEEMKKLEDTHRKEMVHPPQGVKSEELRKYHEEERRALDQQYEQEKKHLQQQDEKQQQREKNYKNDPSKNPEEKDWKNKKQKDHD